MNDLEDEHGLDAVTRLVGLGLLAEGLSEEDSDGAATAWLGTSSGRASLAWFSAVEVVLAFSTEDEPIDGDRVLDLLDAFFDRSIEIWSERASERALARARIIVNNWTDVLCPAVTEAALRVREISDAVQNALKHLGSADGDALEREARELGFYRALAARHVGELIHGEAPDSGPPATADEAVRASAREDHAEALDRQDADEHRKRLDDAREELTRVRAEWSAAVAGAETLSGQSADQVANTQTLTDALAVAVNELKRLQEARSGYRGERDDEKARESDARRALDSAARSLATAEARRAQAQEAVSSGPGSAASALEVACADHVSAVREQLRWARDILKRRRQLRAAAQVEATPVAAKLERQFEGASEALDQARDQLAALRKERRAAARGRQGRAASQEATAELLAQRVQDIEEEGRALKQMRKAYQATKAEIESSRAKLRKRQYRVDDLEDRQAGADEVVAELTDEIGSTRRRLDEVVRDLARGREAIAAETAERLRTVRKRLGVSSSQLEADRMAIAPLKAASLELSKALVEKTRECSEGELALNDAQAKLRKCIQARAQEVERKANDRKVVEAARGMLRNNALRLEEAHQHLRVVQRTADDLIKEQNFASGQQERLARDIVRGQERASSLAKEIEDLQVSIEHTRAAIDRHELKTTRATEKAQAARRAMQERLRQQIAEKQAGIAGLRERVEEATEDRAGLVVAEVRVDGKLESLRSGLLKARGHVASLGTEMAKRRQVNQEQSLHLGTLSLKVAESETACRGAELSIGGLKGDVEVRTRRLSSQGGRFVVLQAEIDAARKREEAAVERVADFQNWVERTQMAIERLVRIPEPPPPPLVPAAYGQKPKGVDSLLAKLQAERMANAPAPPSVPDPSAVPEVDQAATSMLDRDALLDRLEAGDDATSVIDRTTPATGTDGATEVFDLSALQARLEAEDPDSTVVMPRTQRRPKRTRDD